ncbi:acyl-coenzyme A diphosphatase NUDT19-like [Hoplias malabaricus]|uniref:acyl-coenzyme A diphosphatase NUDT19-like n=1 Tax=Hoplias malabaricus TaxID=27720 RepID=UPI003461BEE1
MNSALRHWKEAATLILAAGARRAAPAPRAPRRHADKGSGTTPRSAFDYDVLLLKRSGKSGFMPSASVFPGGLVEATDFSGEWLELFESFRNLPNFGVGEVKQPPETRPPIFSTNRAELGSPVPGDVAFRICAVRETFEEAGVLLAVSADEAERLYGNQDNNNSARSSPTVLSEWDRGVVSEWRSLVIQNSDNFLRMCRELRCLPNIWALHEWGNWLTPVGVYEKQRRYDTAFYMCCLKETPDTVQDQKEIVHFKWSDPSEILSSYRDRDVWIAPPQFYDLGRMCNFLLLNDLHDFARWRSLEGCEQYLPVRLLATDCYISLLPGDSLYPENPDYTGVIKSNVPAEKCLEDLQKESVNMHRIVNHDYYTASVYMNITPKYKHVQPLPHLAPNSISKQDSKL